jgi:hypothetical protein
MEVSRKAVGILEAYLGLEEMRHKARPMQRGRGPPLSHTH